MTDCLCNVGQPCSFPACASKGEPDREIPGAAWCYGHAQLLHEQKVAIWQQRVFEQEERERAGS